MMNTERYHLVPIVGHPDRQMERTARTQECLPRQKKAVNLCWKKKRKRAALRGGGGGGALLACRLLTMAPNTPCTVCGTMLFLWKALLLVMKTRPNAANIEART